MVTAAGSAGSHAVLLKDWAATLPPGTATVEVDEAPMEVVVRIIPGKQGASSVEFRLGVYGGFGLYFGAGFSFEELVWSDSLVVDVLDSIRRGRFRETVWNWRGRIVRTMGELKLGSGRALSDKAFKWPGVLGLGIPREVEYAPWD